MRPCQGRSRGFKSRLPLQIFRLRASIPSLNLPVALKRKIAYPVIQVTARCAVVCQNKACSWTALPSLPTVSAPLSPWCIPFFSWGSPAFNWRCRMPRHSQFNAENGVIGGSSSGHLRRSHDGAAGLIVRLPLHQGKALLRILHGGRRLRIGAYPAWRSGIARQCIARCCCSLCRDSAPGSCAPTPNKSWRTESFARRSSTTDARSNEEGIRTKYEKSSVPSVSPW